ncbi:LLM class flavin-dependent oxidoreductase [Pseudomonas helleri]|uniref:LLM class flavin-dependent oxidoreductase n=1 Tax=Pseudomonas helleri TaxID=1608996 RepID=UPI003F95015E
MARIASATQHMRVGSGGVMLTHYSPFKVAETFGALGTLFPNRIDLGNRTCTGWQLTQFQRARIPRTPGAPRQLSPPGRGTVRFPA